MLGWSRVDFTVLAVIKDWSRKLISSHHVVVPRTVHSPPHQYDLHDKFIFLVKYSYCYWFCLPGSQPSN